MLTPLAGNMIIREPQGFIRCDDAPRRTSASLDARRHFNDHFSGATSASPGGHLSPASRKCPL